MAQTRAVSRALRAPLGQIVALAGYDAAAAEEMPPLVDDGAPATAPEPGPSGSAAAPVEPSLEQWAKIETLIRTLQGADPETDWKTRSGELAGVAARLLTKTGAEILIEKLQSELADVVDDEESE
jgi:hypothetical protein